MPYDTQTKPTPAQEQAILAGSQVDDSKALVLVTNNNVQTNLENLINSELRQWKDWKEKNQYIDFKYQDLWNSVKNKTEAQNAESYKEFLTQNKQNILNFSNNLNYKPKPLGDLGEITLNELVSKGLDMTEPLYTFGKDPITEITVTGSTLSTLFMYRAVIKLFGKVAYGEELSYNTLKNLSGTKAKEVSLFMLIGAPMIVGALYSMAGLSIYKKVALEITVNNPDSLTKSSSSFLFFNKLPKWFKVILNYLLIILLVQFFIWLIGYKNTGIYQIIPINYFLIAIKLFCLISMFLVFYYIWTIYLIINFTKQNKIKIYEIYPNFIKNRILEIENLCNVNPIEQNNIKKSYFKILLVYSSIFFIILISIFLI
jgi:hypothetical protein